MAEEQRSLRSVHATAEQNRSNLDTRADSNSESFQDKLSTTIKLYEECLEIAQRVSLFSPNESLEDISSADLQYLLLHYRLAELIGRIAGGIAERKNHLEKAQKSYEQYLKQLDDYELLSKSDSALLESYQESPTTFSTAATSDAAQRRDIKIRRFREEKELKQKLEYLRQNPEALANDDAAYRSLQLTSIAYATHQTFASLESLAQELHILSLAPPPDAREAHQTTNNSLDSRDRTTRQTNPAATFSDRLDAPAGHLSAGLRGPLLDRQGKPLRPFTLTSSRQEFQQGVFRPDYNLPTMSIDEYLEEERRRGGIIEGGGEASGIRPEVDEDDHDVADQATMKAREWDEFVEANPKGSGNTINRG
ncbi:phosphatase 2A-associated protein [Dissoconium aciculare CBS 342.82]|uniref:Phosphatase 2A-associated protein n=1 Tax=Dissoconium aciculare CBS 342.82 TaxID=1314786 RepID=A0A6J3M3G0_9PEZI|nr:phosphatase 2A-associated protein [Dissoconium aciculare CBS 342.82]KAF1821462.1 phosphatase 2A-associated protein [Dissoconium aciculare CBS 342.82]